MRRFLNTIPIAVLVILLLLTLSACNKASDSTKSSTSSEIIPTVITSSSENSSEITVSNEASILVETSNTSSSEVTAAPSSSLEEAPPPPVISSELPITQIEDLSHPSSPSPEAQVGLRGNKTAAYIPVASGIDLYGNSTVAIDVSNSAEGYVMVKYNGSNSKVKLQMTKDGGSTYTYNLSTSGKYEAFPFSVGSGKYTINIFENISGTSYAQIASHTTDVNLRSSLLPFLYANQYVNYNAESETVKKGASLAANANTDLDVVESVYNYVVKNITYDYNKAKTVTSGYLPNIDSILSSKTGICFDYAAVMTAMLRTQGIPTKLVVGYAGKVYHAWISTYITDVGWVNGIIYFDGTSWVRMDPTFASNGNSSSDIMNFIGNGSNYNAMYFY